MNKKMFQRLKSESVNFCFCKNESELEYLSATPGCSEDYAAVCALPEQWVSRKNGPILANYLKQREESYLQVCENLLNDCKVLNEKINFKVRQLAEFLQAEMQQNELDIGCVLQNLFKEHTVTVYDFNNSLMQVKKLISQITRQLTNFKSEAFILERERATELRRILQCYFQRCIVVGHKSPKELLHEFDEKMYDINQQLLSNSRTYILFEAKLRSQIDENLINARTRLNETVLVGKNTWRTQNDQTWSRDRLHSNLENRYSGRKSPTDSNLSGELKSSSKLLEEYREAILKIFTAISEEFEELRKEIQCRNDIVRECSKPALLKFQNVIEKTIHSLVANAVSQEKSFIEISNDSVLKLQKALTKFGENLKNIYSIFHDAGHVSDAHMMRVALAQKLTMASMEDLIVNHDATQLTNEILTNIAIEQLRAAPDVDKLQQYYDVILMALDRASDLFKQHSEAELFKLEEFLNLVPHLTKTLLSEYNLFLEKNSKTPVLEKKSAVNTPTTGSPKSEMISKGLSVSKEIFQTDLQNVALCTWRNGFLESFKGYMPMVSEQIRQQTQMWVDDKRDVLSMRHSLKLMSHSIRKERIQVARDIRLAEIKFHESRLNSHLDAIYEVFDNLPTEASEYLSLDEPELYPLGQWLCSIQTDMNELFSRDPLDPEVKRLKMCSYASRLLKHRQLFIESLDAAFDQFKKSVEYRVQAARVSNIRFMSQLKLFSEGGTYSAVEATKACAALVKGADTLESCFSRTLDCINHRRSQLLSLADQQILPIQKLVDESLKSVPKGVLDKKKVGTRKK